MVHCVIGKVFEKMENGANLRHEGRKIKVRTSICTLCYHRSISAIDRVMVKDMKNEAAFFFITPVLMHGGLICIALRPSIFLSPCDLTKIQTRK